MKVEIILLRKGLYAEFFHQGGSNKAYLPKKVPNIQRIINDILNSYGPVQNACR